MVGGLFGLAAGGGALAAADGASAAGRTCRLVGHKCVQGRQCCSGLCQTAARRSRIRHCVCPAGKTECRGQCIDLGTMQNCLACGDACGANEVCCDSGCSELGTDDNCSVCGDVCDAGKDELCFGEDGCQHACYGHTTLSEDGYFTTDTPPQYLEGSMFVPFEYTRYLTGNTTTYDGTPCQTSADCTACATLETSTAGWVQTGCGCLQVACGSDVGGNGSWNDLFSENDAYVCSTTKKAR